MIKSIIFNCFYKLQMSQQNTENKFGISSKTFFYVLGVGLTSTALYFVYKLFKNRNGTVDLLKRFQMLDKIQLANDKAQQSLQPLIVQKQISVQDQFLEMKFLLVTKLNDKIHDTQDALKDPFSPPFKSPGLFISQLQPNHRLLFNKFNVYRNHLLVVTKEFESQLCRLSLSDFQQIVFIYRSISGIFFFNRGQKSGASQPHKHIQILPNQAKKLPIYKALQDYAKNLPCKWDLTSQKVIVYCYDNFKFQHGIIPLPTNKSIKQFALFLKRAEETLYREVIEDNESTDYNVIGSDSFLFIVPRKKQKAFQQLSVNSMGFMGSVLFKNDRDLKKFELLGATPSAILQDITFKNY